MSSHFLDFSSCGIVPGFCKSGHILEFLQELEFVYKYFVIQNIEILGIKLKL